jgi:hypothetical protein
MILAKYEKQPAEVKDYDIDYADWLIPAEDTIDTITTTVTSETQATPTLEVDYTEQTLTLAKLWISGGTVGTQYKVTVLMTSEGGRIDESELIFNIKDR